MGHVFKLGTKYSDAMNCTYLDEKGERQSMIMGCYGLGIGRTVAAAVEQSHDDDGIIWPMPIAPFQVVVTQVGKDDNVRAMSEDVYRRLAEAGVEVILDDRDERPGVKFKDADLVGIPFRIVPGPRALAKGCVELAERATATTREVALGEVVAELRRAYGR